MESITTSKEPLSRKRPSHVFRACWECKKRKTFGCSPSDSDMSGLGGANSAGGSSAATHDESMCPLHVGERLSKLEQLFEKFVCRKFSNAETAPVTPQSPPLTEPEPASEKLPKFTFGLPEISKDTQSLSSIGEGIVKSTWSSAPSIRTLVDGEGHAPLSSAETIRRSLVALLPSQHDADVIFESTNGWMVLRTGYTPTKDLFVNQDPETYALDMSAIAKSHSIIVARTLLHLAICINALPPEFNTSRLAHVWSLDAAMQNYVSTVTSLVISSDEQMSTLPGLETLLLLSIFHMNSANLRQAWLIVRRAMNLAHLMGFHRIINHPSTTPPIETVQMARRLWRSIIDSDRYLCLHLRMPFASDEYPVPHDADSHVIHRAQLGALSRKIAETDRNVTPQTYVQALALDEELEAQMKLMSKDFWEVPNVPPTARSPESSMVLERLVVQIWHFELKVFIHLPYLLRAPQETRFEYSKITALQASRNVIMRWFALRNSNITQACCRFSELAAFIATVTIGLDILIEMGTKEQKEVQRTRGSDFAMICRVVGEMEKLAKASPREKIAARSATVIKKILSSLDPSRKNAQKARVSLPYFGTIELEYHKPPVRPTFDLDSDTARKLETAKTGSNVPIFSFVSNELWPSAEGDWEKSLNFDVVLFNGLEDQDTEGDWIF
ncbi:hypothetical protein BU24DRAFT_338974 [Aaosphaeria arxii CBS 175.79]|uniref:Xylanolytic transcriptional activator regulatory domain-containing protein n=1 Tax=Aaosphaeria arxii CBS 175.79 TaxID=1450172 RepID=A0A6A5Y7S7_9PLEO|nr:uncharacterized protein BU24DRAFT_338974 [Aaosphaeria arxii CBS 175.79]KAF2020791.1 hypothetical protein BU24DRAFT_338974 [Aaosphaeria arxii CBS 175.79]